MMQDRLDLQVWCRRHSCRSRRSRFRDGGDACCCDVEFGLVEAGCEDVQSVDATDQREDEAGSHHGQRGFWCASAGVYDEPDGCQ